MWPGALLDNSVVFHGPRWVGGVRRFVSVFLPVFILISCAVHGHGPDRSFLLVVLVLGRHEPRRSLCCFSGSFYSFVLIKFGLGRSRYFSELCPCSGHELFGHAVGD